jgi:hypothetical protein
MSLKTHRTVLQSALLISLFAGLQLGTLSAIATPDISLNTNGSTKPQFISLQKSSSLETSLSQQLAPTQKATGYQTPKDSQTLNLSLKTNQPLIIDLPPYMNTSGQTFKVQTVEMLTNASNGTTNFTQSTNKFTYIPSLDYVGSDLVKFQMCYTDTVCVDVVMNLTVEQAGSTVPQTQLSLSTDQNKPSSVDLAKPNLQVSKIDVISQPAHGSLTKDVTGQKITYTPSENFSGEDTFLFSTCYVANGCVTTKVTMKVQAGEAPKILPVANDDTVSVNQDKPWEADILANDKDDLDGLTAADISKVTPPQHGTAVINTALGKITYTPQPGFNGDDSFTYTLCNPNGCDDATVAVKVIPGNAKIVPQAKADTVTLTSLQPVDIQVLGNDLDELDGVQITDLTKIVTPPTKGSAVINSANGAITYTPNPTIETGDEFTYELCNTNGCATAKVSVVFNKPVDPTQILFTPDALYTAQEEAAEMNVFANDTIFPIESLKKETVKLLSPAKHGVASISPDGLLKYTPEPGYYGIDSVEYTACNTAGKCANTLVKIFIEPKPVIPPVTPNPPVNPNPPVPPTTPVQPEPVKTPTPPVAVHVPNTQVVQKPTGQVLGVHEEKDEAGLIRTGGSENIFIDLVTFGGFFMALHFFSSLYFAKSKEN